MDPKKKKEYTIRVSAKRHKMISRVAKLEGISKKEAAEGMFKHLSSLA